MEYQMSDISEDVKRLVTFLVLNKENCAEAPHSISIEVWPSPFIGKKLRKIHIYLNHTKSGAKSPTRVLVLTKTVSLDFMRSMGFSGEQTAFRRYHFNLGVAEDIPKRGSYLSSKERRSREPHRASTELE
jgi:hypothetical protein